MGWMPNSDDHELLTEFARRGSEAAFATLTARYVSLVYSTALRFTGGAHQAEEITQAVFIILARKAGGLSSRVVLSGWLYQTTRLTAANFIKGEIRRHRREQEAYMQSTLNETDSPPWEALAPWLDEAMGGLGETDRNAVVLRYFENQTAAEIGAALRMPEDTARRRVNRALDKLRKFFGKRGIALSAAAIAGAISANSVSAAPSGLAATISAVAAAKGVAAGTSTLTLIKGTLKIMAWTKAKTAALTAAAVILATGTTVVAVKNSGSARTSGSKSWQTMAQAGQLPSIFTDGLNREHNRPGALYTYPAGDETTHRYVIEMVKKFRKDLDPSRDIKSDTEISDTDIKTRTIYIYGSPENHSLFRRVAGDLPIKFEADGVVVGGKKYLGRDVGAIFTCPDPLSPDNHLVVYGTVSPEALVDMNSIFHGPTDYVIFNNITRQFAKVNDPDRFLLLGSFDKSDPTHWRVSESLEFSPPKALQLATSRVLVAR